MAIYHCSAKIVSRSTGRSSVAAAAYRSGEKLLNEYDGITHDYTKKQGVVYSEIMLCKNAPAEYMNRSTLWNEVEKIEKGKRAQLAREIEIALPTELNRNAQVKLVQDYVKDNFVNAGMCADFSIHDKKDGNPHAHIMLTMRSINEKGQWESKSKKVYLLDRHGNKIYDAKKRQYKCTKENTTDWNDKSKLVSWRERWSMIVNQAYEKKSLPLRIDHRSLLAQGINREPTIHKGSAAHQMEKRGLISDRGNINREVQQRNTVYEREYNDLLRMADVVPKNGLIRERDKSAQEQRNSSTFTTLRTGANKENNLSADQIVAQLSSYKTQYIILKQEMHNISVNDVALQEQRRNLEYKANDMEDRIDNIQGMANRVAQLQRQRINMGAFKGREKRQLTRQIEQLTHSRQQAIRSFGDEYKMDPNHAVETIQKIRDQAKVLQSDIQAQIVENVREKMEFIELQYKKQKALADIRPDGKIIEERLLQKKDGAGGNSIRERMLTAEMETALNDISIDDYQKIVKLVRPDEAQKIVDFVKQRRPDRKRQKSKNQDIIK